MTPEGANRAVVISSLIVGGVYVYRRATEGTSSGISLSGVIGLGNPVQTGAYAAAWGGTFLFISVLASMSPEVGGRFAILVAVGDLLLNGTQVAGQVTKQVSATGTTKTSSGNSSTKVVSGVAAGPTVFNTGVGNPP